MLLPYCVYSEQFCRRRASILYVQSQFLVSFNINFVSSLLLGENPVCVRFPCSQGVNSFPPKKAEQIIRLTSSQFPLLPEYGGACSYLLPHCVLTNDFVGGGQALS